ncbi:hypothetical protein [Sphingobium sp. CFD-2]|uniref:hypothetical protein n=1 Tax=Sphingobium sp. CFD-2 TaxID=2878542 RepID=UPI00214AC6A0|nr:hypothetical protein [Sphingobium sp. CFD-2]
MADDIWTDDAMAFFTLALVEQCARNTGLEDLHSGITPDSGTGDYSDVKVVTPYGEIPWANLSRISDEEMKVLMIEVTNKVFTFLMRADDLLTLGPAARWNRPEYDLALLAKADRSASRRKRD